MSAYSALHSCFKLFHLQPGEVMEVRNPMFSAETPTGTQSTNTPQDPPQQ